MSHAAPPASWVAGCLPGWLAESLSSWAVAILLRSRSSMLGSPGLCSRMVLLPQHGLLLLLPLQPHFSPPTVVACRRCPIPSPTIHLLPLSHCPAHLQLRRVWPAPQGDVCR